MFFKTVRFLVFGVKKIEPVVWTRNKAIHAHSAKD